MSRGVTAAVGAIFLAASAGIAGFVVYPMMMETHEANYVNLEDVGEALGAKEIYEETTGELGAKQMPSTFADDKLTPTQKVIKGLVDDRDSLIQDNKVLEDRIAELKLEIAALENYKETNERFAPLNAAEEQAMVESLVKKFLINSEDAERFSTLQIEVMSAVSAMEFSKFVGRNRLILDDKQRKSLVDRHFPEFAFCVGDGVDVAANSNRELTAISYFIRSQDPSRISPVLLQDLETVLKPCQNALFANLSSEL